MIARLLAATARILAALVVCLGLATATAPAQARAAEPGLAFVDILDVGQGDAILIRSPEGKTALVDAGLDKRVVDRIRELGVNTIDLVVVSHHHTDHYGGMDDVIKAFHPRMYLATGSPHTTSNYLKLLKLVKAEGMTAIEPKSQPRRIMLGSVEITVLPQPPENPKEENDNSIGLRVQYGAFSILMTGDSEERSRSWWTRKCPELIADCDVLKLAHHGSRNGTNEPWLDVVRPEIAVASLGDGNDYGHPHSETLSLLRRYQIPLLRTDKRGTITIRTDGRRWRIDPAAFARNAPQDGKVGTASGEKVAATATRTASSSTRGRSWRNTARDGASTVEAASGDKVNLNTASLEELETLPGIGPSTARKIVANRPYRKLDDLSRVAGFNEARMAEIRSSVIVR